MHRARFDKQLDQLNSPGAEVCNQNEKQQNSTNKENQRAMRFGAGETLRLTLKSAAWQWTSSAYSDLHRQKDSTQTFKKQQDVSPKNTFTYHTHVSWLSPPPPP